MSESVNPRLIKTNIDQLTRLVKRPTMVTEKILARPPFRFLHDLTTLIVKNTGYFRGLFTESEFVFDNVNSKELKIAFLDKLIDAIGFVNGKSLDVKAAKIVAGVEVEKTNRLLNEFAKCVQDKKPFLGAVDKVRKGQKPPAAAAAATAAGKAKPKASPAAKQTGTGTKRTTVPAAAGSKSTTKTQPVAAAKEATPKPVIIPEPEPEPEEPVLNNSTINGTIAEEEEEEEEEEDPPVARKESAEEENREIEKNSRKLSMDLGKVSKDPAPQTPVVDPEESNKNTKNILGIQQQEEEDNDLNDMDKLLDDNIDIIEDTKPEPKESMESKESNNLHNVVSNTLDNEKDINQISNKIAEDGAFPVGIPDNNLDSQPKSAEKREESLAIPIEEPSDPVPTIKSSNRIKSSRLRPQKRPQALSVAEPPPPSPTPPSTTLQIQSSISPVSNRRNSSTSAAPMATTLKSTSRGGHSTGPEPEATSPSVQGRKNPSHRSARPSSSRPAPPRVMTASQRATLGRVVESRLEMLPPGGGAIDNDNQQQLNWLNTMNDTLSPGVGGGEQDDDGADEYVISSQKLQESLLKMNSGPDNNNNNNFNQNNEQNLFYADTDTKGFLVQQLMDSKSDLEGPDNTGPNLDSTVQIGSNSMNTGKIRSNVQGLCQSIGTLSKALDYLHEDIDPMMDELRRWNQEYRDNLQTIGRLKSESKKEIEPLQQELDRLDNESKEFRQKLSSIKANVYRNNLTIAKLIESV